MKRHMFGSVGLAGWFVIFFSLSAFAQNNQSSPFLLGMTTGGESTTAYRIGEDIRDLVRSRGIDLTIRPSRGDIENIVAVYQRPGNHLGLVASDVLAFVKKVGDAPRVKLIDRKIKWVFPLYDREVHLVAGEGINTFADLNDKRVAIGDEESGAYLTCRLLFEISGITPREMVAIDGGKALAALRDGRIDAMIAIDGAPIGWLNDWVASVDGLHLVSIADAHIGRYYPAALIPGGSYTWQHQDVETVSVTAVLVTYDFDNQYCQGVGKLARLIRDNLAWLGQHGHPKWKTVDLDAQIKGWEPFECVDGYAPNPQDELFAPLAEFSNDPVVEAIHRVFKP